MLHVSQLAPSAYQLSLVVFACVFIIVVFTAAMLAAKAASRRRRSQGTRSGPRSGDISESESIGPARYNARAFVLALGNPDWEARSAAVLALGIYGDESTVEPLVETLLKDQNDVVRENAALSLNRINCVRAVDPLIRVVRDYVRGTEKGTRLAVTAAQILGEAGAPKAVSCLKGLHERLERDGLQQEAKRVSMALSKARSSTKITGKKCCVCNLAFKKGDEIVRCPLCGNVAHKTHMLEWLHVRGCCPVCQEHISESALELA